jgi:hypothetical protein
MSAPTATQPAQPAQPAQAEIMPSPAVLTQTAKLAMKKDKAIHLDYYVETATGKAFLGQDTTTGEKCL